MNTITDESLNVESISPTVEVQHVKTTSSECKICGASALYSYFGAVTCQPCKVFFKRNAETRQDRLKCYFDGNCDINMNNRHTCASCRLKKCFAIGLRSEMIRCSRPQKSKEKRKKNSTSSISTNSAIQNYQNQPKEISTLNLLRSDQSILNINQWNLLSNLVHWFDEHGGYSFAEHFTKEQNALPVKQRFKYSVVKGFFTSIKIKIQLVREKNRDFRSLSPHDRQNLFQISIEHITSFGEMFTLRQHKLFDYPSFYQSAEMIFGSTAVAFTGRAINQLDPDDTFIKLIIAVLFFTTTNYTIYEASSVIYLTNIKAVLAIQDMYTEIAWRYVLYKYGQYESMKRFSNVIRCLFLVINATVEAHESKPFTEMMDTVIQQTEHTLHVDSNPLWCDNNMYL